jgi:3-phenylpropionate/trans-cinnamate dioxygenase ferredoxin reductase component
MVMVSADDRLPYFRPYVSKEFLAGDVGADQLRLEEPDWYGANGVDVMLGCTVTGIDLTTRVVSTDTGDPLRWGDCVLATGSAARSLRIPGAEDPAVLTLRHASDAERLLTASGPVVVVGSGFVGCEAAAGLRRLGRDVTVVSQEEVPQADRLGAEVGALIASWLRDTGVDLRGNVGVAHLERHGDELVVAMSDGTRIAAATVVAAVGAEPQLDLAASMGMVDDAHSGVAVSATMQTAADGVFAVGDIATAWHSKARRSLRVEHWGDAEAHGQTAGLRIAGVVQPWTTPPGFWSTIAGETIKHVAWGDGYDDVRVVRSSAGETCWYGRDGVVVGVLTHGHDEDAELAPVAVGEAWPMPS